MKMSRLEKRMVNRENKGKHNIKLLNQQLAEINRREIHDVLEIGCGFGYVSDYLSKEYKMNVTGTDFDPEQVRGALNLFAENKMLRFQTEDAASLSFNDNSFDLVISQYLFHHIPEWRKAIGEVARVLRSGGYFIWHDLTPPTLVKRLVQSLIKNYGIYTLEEVISQMQQYDLKKIFNEKRSPGIFINHRIVFQKL